MRILNVRVERVGIGAGNTLVAQGRDVVGGWSIAFVVPAARASRVLADVRAGRHPVLSVPEVDALPWRSVSGVAWEQGAPG